MNEIFNEKRWEENPNPKAKIAFVIFYPFQYYVYKNIYKHLDDAEFIIDLGAFYPVRQRDELGDSIVILLRQKGVYFRILYYSDYLLARYLQEYFSRYTTLVGVWERGCHFLDCNWNKKQVNLTYGAGKELTQVRFGRRYHDLILAFGSRDVKLFSLFTEAKVVGNPKFDDWFNNELDQDFIHEMRGRLSSDKKTILYLPTHSDLSSLDDLMDELGRLSVAYNVIVKMHYFTVQEEPEKMTELSNAGMIVLSDEVDLLPLLKISDVVLSDNSSAIFDALLADKPLVVTDFLSQSYLDVDHKRARLYRRGETGALTYSGSIEQTIKKDGSVITMKNPSEASVKIEKALQDLDFYRRTRKKIREELFSFNDGRCGLRAAEEIKKVSSREAALEKPILFHAIEAEISQMQHKYFLLEKDRNRKIRQYDDILLERSVGGRKENKVFFSVIVLDDGSGDLETTLHSLCNQDFPASDYEIIVVSVRAEAGIIGRMKKSEPMNESIDKIAFVSIESACSIGNGILRAFHISGGRVICFAQSGYFLQSKWLTLFFMAYERSPSTAGVGGYISKLFEGTTILEEFFYLEVGKKLGIWKLPGFLAHLYEVRNNVFYQNPAGSFRNISYKRDILEDFLHIFEGRTIQMMELELKILVTTQNDICFIPYPVHRIDPWTLREFIKENFFQGIAFRSAYNLYPLIEKTCRVTFLTAFFAAFSLPVYKGMRGRFLLPLTAFFAYFLRWIGGLYWVFQRIMSIGAALSYHAGRKNDDVSSPTDKNRIS